MQKRCSRHNILPPAAHWVWSLMVSYRWLMGCTDRWLGFHQGNAKAFAPYSESLLYWVTPDFYIWNLCRLPLLKNPRVADSLRQKGYSSKRNEKRFFVWWNVLPNIFKFPVKPVSVYKLLESVSKAEKIEMKSNKDSYYFYPYLFT